MPALNSGSPGICQAAFIGARDRVSGVALYQQFRDGLRSCILTIFYLTCLRSHSIWVSAKLFMHNTRLPHGLIDLLFAPTQATSRRGFPALCIALRTRLAHSAAALQTGDHTQYSTIDDRSLYSSCAHLYSTLFPLNISL